jgi:hypothetical protein
MSDQQTTALPAFDVELGLDETQLAKAIEVAEARVAAAEEAVRVETARVKSLRDLKTAVDAVRDPQPPRRRGRPRKPRERWITSASTAGALPSAGSARRAALRSFPSRLAPRTGARRPGRRRRVCAVATSTDALSTHSGPRRESGPA